MKDVVSCDKPGGAAHKHYIPGSPNGTTQCAEGALSCRKAGSQPPELKHLSRERKRKQTSDSLSSGERKGNSPNSPGVPGGGCRTTFRSCHQAEFSGKLSHSG